MMATALHLLSSQEIGGCRGFSQSDETVFIMPEYSYANEPETWTMDAVRFGACLLVKQYTTLLWFLNFAYLALVPGLDFG